jgi:hypothetical protein
MPNMAAGPRKCKDLALPYNAVEASARGTGGLTHVMRGGAADRKCTAAAEYALTRVKPVRTALTRINAGPQAGRYAAIAARPPNVAGADTL